MALDAGLMETTMTRKTQDKKQPAPRALTDEALDQAVGAKSKPADLAVVHTYDKSSPVLK